MITLIEMHNPFDSDDVTISEHPADSTIWEMIKTQYPDFIEFDRPTICLVDGQAYLRKEWTMTIQDNSRVVLSAIPAWDYVIYAVISLVVSYAALQLFPVPNTNLDLPDPESVFTIAGQYNQLKLNQPVESHYGTVPHYPSYAAKPWTEYVNNEQYQNALFCIGVGEYTLNGIYIEDTPFADFDDVSYAVYPPDTPVDLFWVATTTSVEVSNLEMIGMDETGWDWLGPFTVTPVGKETGQIQVDVILPAGLYTLDNDGNIDVASVSWAFEYREINDSGTPIGSWTSFETYTLSAYTTSPLRYTITSSPLSGVGRVEVRGRRTNNKLGTTRGQDKLIWERVRVFRLNETNQYADVTMLAVRIKATNQLNDQSKARIKVDVTRKLPLYDGSSGLTTGLTATTQITPAFYDIFVADYGGQLDESYLDFEQIDDQELEFNTGDAFSHTFDQQLTVWEAAKIVAKAGRGTPMMNGSLVQFIRDGIKSIPTAVFGVDNIRPGSLKYNINLVITGDHDGILAEYLDSNTGKIETVKCILSGESGNNLQTVKAFGMRDRDHAYREMMYQMAKIRRVVETVSFVTGKEGLIPTYGDLIGVTHPIVRTWGVSGYVISQDGLDLTLSEDVVFESGESYQIAFRKEDGSQNGPYTVTETTDANVVTLASPVSPALYFDAGQDPTYFYFGKTQEYSKFLLLTDRQPSEGEDVAIEAVVYDSSIHEADGTSAPAIGTQDAPDQYPARPEVDEDAIEVHHLPDNIYVVQVSWPVAYGARRYRVERKDPDSPNGEYYLIDEVTRNSIYIDVEANSTLDLRVAAINEGIGEWAYITETVGVPMYAPPKVTGITLKNPVDEDNLDVFSDRYFRVGWHANPLAESYTVKTYAKDFGGTYRLLSTKTGLTTFEYAFDAVNDFRPLWGSVTNMTFGSREFKVEVIAVNSIGSSAAASIEISNPVPPAISGVSVSYLTGNLWQVNWTIPDEDARVSDFRRYRIYYDSSDSGFSLVDADGSTPQSSYAFGVLISSGVHDSGSSSFSDYIQVIAEDHWSINPTHYNESNIDSDTNP